MYVSVIFLVVFVFYMNSARAGLLSEKMKLSATQHDSCPPGVWSCPTGKRSEIGKASRDTTDALLFLVKMALNVNKEFKDSSRLKSKEDPEDCPPGMWVCKKKGMLKQMLKTALKKSQKSKGRVVKRDTNHACPPGVWSCPNGKPSEIIY